MAARIKLTSPSGEVKVVDLTGVKDVAGLSVAVCKAFPSLAGGSHRVVGFELPTGIVLIPSLVLNNVQGYASRGLRVVLDSEFDDAGSTDGGAVEGKDSSGSVSSAAEETPVSPAPSTAHVVRGPDDGFPLRLDLFPGDVVGLSFTREAVSDLFSLVVGTNLCGIPFKDVARRFKQEVSPRGELSKAGFHSAVQALVPRELLSSKERHLFSSMLNTLFLLSDRDGSKTVDAAEFISAFSLFCAGQKSSKLAGSFGLFDSDGDGQLSRRELWKFIRSFLTALFSVSCFRSLVSGGDSAAALRAVVIELIDDTAVEATRLMFASYPGNKALSFDDFGTWYNQGGYLILPWVELLDLKKWPKNIELDIELASAQQAVVPPPKAAAAIPPPPGIAPRPTKSAKPASPAAVPKPPKPSSAAVVIPPPPPPPQPTTAVSSAPALVFSLSSDCVPLVLSQVDIRRFLDFLVASGLCDVRPKTLIRELIKVEKDGAILPADFAAAVKTLVSPGALNAKFSPLSEHTVLSALEAFFTSFDLYGGEVDASEFLSGFLLLASGSKSDKLAVAYNLFDTTGTGKLSRRNLWKFLRSFLTALSSLSSECSTMETDDLQRLVDAGAVEITADVFLKADRESKDLVSFDEFGRWYNSGGYQQAPWLELLDHSKWIPRVANAAEPPAAPAPAAPPAVPEATDASGTVLLQFKLTTSESGAPGGALVFTVADCAKLSQVLSLTKFNKVDPEYMHTLFNTQSRDGVLSKSGFDACIRQLVPGSSLSESQRTYLTVILSTLFFAYSSPETSSVPFNEFSTGFSLLAAGSKSEKLSLAFRLFDDDEDGSLNRKQLFLYLRSFLTILVTLHDPFTKMDRTVLSTILKDAAADFTDCVFRHSRRAKTGLITYEEFGRWYNDGGHVVAPWLELLDLKKWPLAPSALVSDAAEKEAEKEDEDAVAEDKEYEYLSSGDEEEDNQFIPSEELQKEDDAASDASDAVFEFSLVPEQSVVRLTATDVRHLKFLVTDTPFPCMSAADIIASLKYHSTQGVLQKDGFDAFLEEYVPTASSYLILALNNLYYAFDREDNGSVDTAEFAAAFTLLAEGSKSDKLMEIFDLFDESKRSKLTKLGLWKFFRAVLTMIGGVVSITHELTDADLSAAAVDRGAINITSTIFREAALAEADRISYEEFGTWYNSGGYKVIPWLELLDLKKWPNLLQGGPAQQAAPDSDDDEEEEEENDEAPVSDAVFCFTLGPKYKLNITQADCDHVTMLSNITGMAQLPLKTLHAALCAEADRETGLISRVRFAAALRSFISSEHMSTAQQQDFGETLFKVFTALSHLEVSQPVASTPNGPDGQVDLASLVVAMSLLSSGSKSDKLSLGFHTFDDSGVDGEFPDGEGAPGAGYLTKASLTQNLTAVLVAILSVQVGPSTLTGIVESALEGAKTVVDLVFDQTDLIDRITFEEFGSWYNAGGFEVVPWLELLDLKKWPSSGAAAAPAAAASSDDDTAAAVEPSSFVFPLNSQGDSLVIDSNVVVLLQRLLELSHYNRVEPDELYALFDSEATGGSLSLTAFHRCLQRSISFNTLPADSSSFLQSVFSDLFAAFDGGDGKVNDTEFSAGFSVLSAGSKSDKLSLAFRLFDSDGDGAVTLPELRGFLRSFVTILCALAKVHSPQQAPQSTVVARTVQQVAANVFEDTGLPADGVLTYERFGTWYNDGGFRQVPWLELLDLKKWSTIAKAGTPKKAPASKPQSAPAPATFTSADAVSVTDGDVAQVTKLLRVSKLDRVNTARVHEAFLSQLEDASSDSLDKPTFDRVIRTLIPGSSLSRDDRAFLSRALTNLFFSFKVDQEGSVDFSEFVAGFSLLSSGAKSDKLALAFRLFDEDGDGYISRGELQRYLKAFLTFLTALQRCFSEILRPELVNAIDASAAELASLILDSAALDKEDQISFEQFGTWYNSGGFEVVPWLELLDLKKWPAAASSGKAESKPAAPGPAAKKPAPKANLSSLNTAGAPAPSKPIGITPTPTSQVTLFAFPLANGATLNIRRQDVKNLARVLQLSGLSGVPPEDVHQVFEAVIGPGGAINKEGFDEAVGQLVPALSSDPADNSFLSFALDNIFYAFDRDNSGSVYGPEFVTAFTVLASGSKSDKLSLGFRALDSDEDGLLTHDQLVTFLQGFLTLLGALRGDSGVESDAQATALAAAISSTASAVASQVEAASEGAEDGVSYDAFGGWYNSVGFRVVPWLELLDLKKWPDDTVGSLAAAPALDNTSDEASDSDDAVPQISGNVVFLFQLLEDRGSDLNTLAMTYQDCASYQRALAECAAAAPAAVQGKFADFLQPNSTLGSLGLQRTLFVELACAALRRPDGPRQHLAPLFANAFALYQSVLPGPASLPDHCDVLAGLCATLMLAAGSKSDKLSVAFRAFDKDGDDRLSASDLQKFFASFLTFIVSVSGRHRAADVSVVAGLIKAAAARAVDRILASPFSASKESVSFVEFGQWYNAAGHEFVPWLELLDARKWPNVLSDEIPGVDDDDEDDSDFEPESSDDEDEDEDEDSDGLEEEEENDGGDGDGEDGDDDDGDEDEDEEEEEGDALSDARDPPAFLFALPPTDATAKLSNSDIAAALEVLELSNITSLKPSEVANALLPLLPSAGVTAADFDEAVAKLVNLPQFSDADKDKLTSFFSRVYFVLSGHTPSPAPEVVVVALALFAAGSKSDKLNFAFKRLSDPSTDGLSAEELSKFLTCFLAPLLSMSASATSSGVESLCRKVKQTVSYVVRQVLEFVSKAAAGGTGDSKDGPVTKVSFADFGHWYNVEGHTLAPWIELLNVGKWRLYLNGASN